MSVGCRSGARVGEELAAGCRAMEGAVSSFDLVLVGVGDEVRDGVADDVACLFILYQI